MSNLKESYHDWASMSDQCHFWGNFLKSTGWFFRSANCLENDIQRANCRAKHQWICFGYSSSREPPIEPKKFFELLTSHTHLLNTEARYFDHFLNFPNRANVHTYIIVFHDAYVTHQHLWPGWLPDDSNVLQED